MIAINVRTTNRHMIGTIALDGAENPGSNFLSLRLFFVDLKKKPGSELKTPENLQRNFKYRETPH